MEVFSIRNLSEQKQPRIQGFKQPFQLVGIHRISLKTGTPFTTTGNISTSTIVLCNQGSVRSIHTYLMVGAQFFSGGWLHYVTLGWSLQYLQWLFTPKFEFVLVSYWAIGDVAFWKTLAFVKFEKFFQLVTSFWEGQKQRGSYSIRFHGKYVCYLMWYGWWTKSCTSWYSKYPIIYRVLYIPGGAGFLPPTVLGYPPIFSNIAGIWWPIEATSPTYTKAAAVG